MRRTVRPLRAPHRTRCVHRVGVCFGGGVAVRRRQQQLGDPAAPRCGPRARATGISAERSFASARCGRARAACAPRAVSAARCVAAAGGLAAARAVAVARVVASARAGPVRVAGAFRLANADGLAGARTAAGRGAAGDAARRGETVGGPRADVAHELALTRARRRADRRTLSSAGMRRNGKRWGSPEPFGRRNWRQE